jgi:DinB superfamily
MRPLKSRDVNVEPLVPAPDDKDWTLVLDAPCLGCGFDAVAIRTTDVSSLVRGTATAFTIALQRPGARERTQPGVWSVLEYGCHLRDVCGVFDERVRLMLSQDDPLFPNWDQDATALAERYWTQEPAVVTTELAAAAETIARSFDRVDVEQWSRPGRRSNGSVFTVDSLARYFLHELVHHLHDIGA